jgi:hypothetical protein
MGKGILQPDSRTLEDCEVPVFKTHATPVNVAITPEHISIDGGSHRREGRMPKGGRAAAARARQDAASPARRGGGGGGGGSRAGTATSSTGCSCSVM